MHVVIATPLSPPQAGGPSYYSEGLRDGFVAEGHTVSLVSFSTYRMYPKVVRHVAFAAGLWKPLKTADLVISLDTWSVAIPTVLMARLFRTCVFVRSGGDFLWERFVERTRCEVPLSTFYQTSPPLSFYERILKCITRRVVFALPTRVVFSSQWQQALTVAAYTIPYERTAVIENVQPVRSVPEEPPSKRFVWVGRPLFLKNTARLARAFERARATCPEIELVTLANVPQEEAHRVMRRAWALVLPSLSEVTPNIALEALSFGVPVILTKETGYCESLKDSVLFVDPLSLEDIVAAVIRMADSNERRMWHARAAALPWGRTYRDIARDFLVLYGYECTLGGERAKTI